MTSYATLQRPMLLRYNMCWLAFRSCTKFSHNPIYFVTKLLSTRHHKLVHYTNKIDIMGCTSSKQAPAYGNNYAKPMAGAPQNGHPPPQGYAPPQQQNGKKNKAVKAGTAAGFVSMLAG